MEVRSRIGTLKIDPQGILHHGMLLQKEVKAVIEMQHVWKQVPPHCPTTIYGSIRLITGRLSQEHY